MTRRAMDNHCDSAIRNPNSAFAKLSPALLVASACSFEITLLVPSEAPFTGSLDFFKNLVEAVVGSVGRFGLFGVDF